MTPELLRAIELHERERFQALGSELTRIERSLENEHSSRGTLRTGGFLGALVAGKVEALTDNARAVTDSYVALASKAGLIHDQPTRAVLADRLRKLTHDQSAAMMRWLHERVQRTRLPDNAFTFDLETRLTTFRSNAQSYLERQFAEADLMPNSDNPTGQTIIYSLSGSNARFNINSTDSSTNVVSQTPEGLFTDLRAAIQSEVAIEEERDLLLERVAELEAESGEDGFPAKYAQFMALAANHVEALAPFFPALAQMLTA